ncbi:hypothetical protein L917_04967 [Phytophthora nicotianae]|uniref:EF-hand domain-containing protein n=2 Tax=Phytophthora nicotianae TaxID=4792 RepID=V9FLU0_PHYNI|nr:hypothetical protein F443_05261 [Phytophthora nicotianae P1569]ETL97815.1 hypothetical protein L917_04967 [Phytophthora nicotianae]ETM50978.1 hypothetical protein L914_05080 [Phytophthora nicotianae]
MEGPPVGSLALSGAGYTLDKTRSNRPARPGGRIPRLVPKNDPVPPSKITTVDALIKELRKVIHAMFCTVDPSIPSSSAYENYSRQAFRFFTTTNTITQECFHHKVVRLGLHATPRLCNELFRRIDQLDLGEIDYATFAQRVFLPETFFSPDEPPPIAATNSPTVRDRTNRPGIKSPRVSASKSNNASSSPRSSASKYEYMALDELEKYVARKLEEKMPRGSTDPVAQAFKFFTNLETITFADFHRHLGMLQIQLSPPKCRELFVRFDKDGDGVIDTIEFVTTLFSKENRSSRPSSARSSRSESDQDPSLSTKQLVATIREKMDQLSEETDRFQQAFMLLGKPTGISRSDLNTAMKKLGLSVSNKQLQDLFATFDFDKTGDLDVNKFVQGVMLDDNSTSFWLSVKDRQKVEDSRRKLYSMAVASVQESWTIADIERMLREKIEQRTSRSSDCFRQAFRIFKKVNGIKPHEFHAALEAIGLALTRVQSDILFRRFDKDGSGDIDLNEFIHGVLPPDYMGISWVAAADEMHRIEAKKKKEEALANPDQYMTEIEMESWSLDEIEMRIRDKIMQTTSRSSDTFRQAYKIFKKASHVTMDEFRERLLALGFRLTPAQCLGLFKRYDTDNSNDLDLQEFCLKILPPDYTHDGDHWSHSEKYKKERHRQKLEYVKRSKNGLIMLPKFIESHRFTRGHHVSHSFQEMQQESTPSFDSRIEGSSTSGGTRPSTCSSVDEKSPRPTTPKHPRTARPPASSPESSINSRHVPSPRPSGKSTPLSPTSPLASASPRRLRATEPQAAQANPVTSPRILSPTRPMSPRAPPSTRLSPHSMNRPSTPMSPHTSRPQTPLSPHTSRPATPRKSEDAAIEYEDEEIIEDDVASQDLARAKLMSRHRRKYGKSSRHRNSYDTASQISVRPAESVTGSTTSTSSVAVGTAKHMPQRNHVLLIKRFMQAAGKGLEHHSTRSIKRVSVARR